jgi:hypothetical protein
MRVGQKTHRTRVWARTGTRPRQVADLRTGCAYLYGAICPERGVGAAMVMQRADTWGMQLHLDEISGNIAPGAHAMLVLDQAGWHTTGKLKTPSNHHPLAAAAPVTRTQPRRKRLATPPPAMALQPHLQRLRRHPRRRLRRLEPPHRRSRPHHLHRNAIMGAQWSSLRAVGIRRQGGGGSGDRRQDVETILRQGGGRLAAARSQRLRL